MRVLMIAPEPFFEPRGTPISVYHRLEALSSLGHEVDLLTYHVGNDVNFQNVRIIRTPKLPFINKVKVGPSWVKFILDVLLFFKSIILLTTRRYDVIHSHEEASFFSGTLASIFQCQHLYDMHSILSRQLDNFNFGNWWALIKAFRLLERRVLNTCDAVITIGCDLEDYVRRVNPNLSQMTIENIAIHSAQSPVDESLIKDLREKLNLNGRLPIVYTGTFERYQGLDLLLETTKIIKKKMSNICLILVGAKPPYVEQWQEKVRLNHLENDIFIINSVSPKEASVFLSYAEVLVSPRRGGTTVPLKIYSYLHSGKPIVATDNSAHRQVLNENIALLVEPTQEAFAQGILKILEDPDFGQRLGAQAQKYARENYNYIDYLEKVNKIYSVLERNIRGAGLSARAIEE